ncbi:hypothetical protein M9H77_11872 [Catharanthus roseus]|uniref:Uncharacterized protein n=1 Tax=Catharanthus roseus TaxID=4058 RepID=A0ACC0BFW0_CATRO|nr:hypothetical protein M9H77_11872 [Catharanthus roseus]
MPQIQRGKLVPCDPEPERTLQSACCTLRFETMNNNTIITVDKMKEGQHDPPLINLLQYLITKYILLVDARMQSMEAAQRNQEASIHNLENQIEYNTEKNPREHAKAVTLRSGKELVETPLTVMDKEKEIVQAPEEYSRHKSILLHAQDFT